jgi:predicted RND superfamily exporter protein
VEAVREFGLLAAGAVLLAAAANLAAFPLTVRMAGRQRPPAAGPAWRALTPALAWALGRRTLLVRASLLVLALALSIVGAVDVDHQPLDLLRAGDPLRLSCTRLADSVRGLAPLEYFVDLPGAWTEASSLRLLAATAHAMEDAAGVGPALSIVEPVKLAASVLRGGAPGSYALPESDVLLALAARSLRQVPATTRRLVSTDGRRARVLIPFNIVGGRAFAAARARLEETTARSGLPARPAGLIHRLMEAQATVLQAQVSSLLVASAAVSLLVGAVLGNRAQALAVLAVNLAPLVLSGALLAAFQVPLDLSTAMVASIALGIAADDTAHLLWCFGSARGTPVARADAALARAGAGILTKNTVVAAGFLVIAAARFPPVARFGALTAATLLLSMASHLFILPAWLARGATRPAPAAETASTPCPSLP